MNFNASYSFNKMDEVVESYEIKEDYIVANISEENLGKVALDFAKLHSAEKLYFILEVPMKEDEELELQKGNITKFHNKVYYIDWLSTEAVKDIIDDNIEIFKNNGLICWGIGCQDSHDELMVLKYNVLIIYSTNIINQKSIFENLGIKYVNDIKTSWDYINKENPGKASQSQDEKYNMEDAIKMLTEKYGMYFAENRECI